MTSALLITTVTADYIKASFYRDSSCKDLYSVTFGSPADIGAVSCKSFVSAKLIPSDTCIPTNASNGVLNTFTKLTCVDDFKLPEDVASAFGPNTPWLAISSSKDSKCSKIDGAIAYVADGSCVLRVPKAEYGPGQTESYKYVINPDKSVTFFNYTGTRDCSSPKPENLTAPASFINSKTCVFALGYYSSFYGSVNTASIKNPVGSPSSSDAGSHVGFMAVTLLLSMVIAHLF